MTTPKILFYDVETTPLRAYVWRTGKQYVDQSSIIRGDMTKIICIAYKWAHEKTVKCLVWNNKTQNCDSMIEEFSKIIATADVAIAHNGDAFDVKHINTQRLLAKKAPLAWPTTEDSITQIRKIFYLPSYRLDYIAKLLLNKGKSPMRFQDWIDIIEDKSETALRKMVKYCKRDVALLAEAYELVRPFLKPKTSRAKLSGGECPSCGSASVHKKGTITLKTNQYPRFQCQDCGHWYRSSTAVKKEVTKKG